MLLSFWLIKNIYIYSWRLNQFKYKFEHNNKYLIPNKYDKRASILGINIICLYRTKFQLVLKLIILRFFYMHNNNF